MMFDCVIESSLDWMCCVMGLNKGCKDGFLLEDLDIFFVILCFVGFNVFIKGFFWFLNLI